MIAIPLTGFVIAYFILLAILLIFYAIIIYQLVATGTFTSISIVVTIILSAAMVAVLVTTAGYASAINWNDVVTLFGDGTSSIF